MNTSCDGGIEHKRPVIYSVVVHEETKLALAAQERDEKRVGEVEEEIVHTIGPNWLKYLC